MDDKLNKDLTIPSSVETGPVSFAIFKLARAHRAIAANLLRKLGLHPTQEILLMHLLDQDGVVQNELVKRVGFDASTATKMLQRLENEGLLVRKQSSSDKRAMVVHLTAKGKGLKSKLIEMWQELERRSTASLSQEQKTSAIEVLSYVEQSLINTGKSKI